MSGIKEKQYCILYNWYQNDQIFHIAAAAA